LLLVLPLRLECFLNEYAAEAAKELRAGETRSQRVRCQRVQSFGFGSRAFVDEPRGPFIVRDRLPRNGKLPIAEHCIFLLGAFGLALQSLMFGNLSA
jgi:hypothetical protein